MIERDDNWRAVRMVVIVRAERLGFTWLRDPARPGWRAIQSPRGRRDTFQILFCPLRRRRIDLSEYANAA